MYEYNRGASPIRISIQSNSGQRAKPGTKVEFDVSVFLSGKPDRRIFIQIYIHIRYAYCYRVLAILLLPFCGPKTVQITTKRKFVLSYSRAQSEPMIPTTLLLLAASAVASAAAPPPRSCAAGAINMQQDLPPNAAAQPYLSFSSTNATACCAACAANTTGCFAFFAKLSGGGGGSSSSSSSSTSETGGSNLNECHLYDAAAASHLRPGTCPHKGGPKHTCASSLWIKPTPTPPGPSPSPSPTPPSPTPPPPTPAPTPAPGPRPAVVELTVSDTAAWTISPYVEGRGERGERGVGGGGVGG